MKGFHQFCSLHDKDKQIEMSVVYARAIRTFTFQNSNASKSKVDQCSARNLRVCCPFLWETCLK